MTMLKYSLVIFDDLNFIILIWTSRLKLSVCENLQIWKIKLLRTEVHCRTVTISLHEYET